jgi:tRNA threonylcarbamoyladenosine biosynthesis protein TsaB
MTHLLHIETSGKNCSVAISAQGKLLAHRSVLSDQFVHAEQLHVLLDEVIHESQIEWKNLAAIAVSKGPGSYTGLRIGVSAAKGLCFTMGCKLIAIDTTAILAHHAAQDNPNGALIIPMIDARRMEVYAAEFDTAGKRLTDDEAIILDEVYFEKFKQQQVILIGDGAAKCSSIAGPNATFREVLPDASMMIALAESAFARQQFEDVAYFEPHYLKAYVPGISKRSVL